MEIIFGESFYQEYRKHSATLTR